MRPELPKKNGHIIWNPQAPRANSLPTAPGLDRVPNSPGQAAALGVPARRLATLHPHPGCGDKVLRVEVDLEPCPRREHRLAGA